MTSLAKEKKLSWLKPETVVGGRTAITSTCGLFCITKKNGVYQPMKLKGSIWQRLETATEISVAKQTCLEG